MNTLREVLRNIKKVERIDILGPCWEWQGFSSDKGYGLVIFRSQKMRVHRLVASQYIGELTPSVLVCHSCDNPPCCNPSHLFIGTAKDNYWDAISKGRISESWIEHVQTSHSHSMASRARQCENHKHSKLTVEIVTALRREASRGVRRSELVEMFGISRTAISRVINGRTWKHIPMTPEVESDQR